MIPHGDLELFKCACITRQKWLNVASWISHIPEKEWIKQTFFSEMSQITQIKKSVDSHTNKQTERQTDKNHHKFSWKFILRNCMTDAQCHTKLQTLEMLYTNSNPTGYSSSITMHQHNQLQLRNSSVHICVTCPFSFTCWGHLIILYPEQPFWCRNHRVFTWVLLKMYHFCTLFSFFI